MKKALTLLLAICLLFPLSGCGSEIPTSDKVSSYLKNTYGIENYEVVDTGYSESSFSGSKINYGYVTVNVQGIEFKVNAGDFNLMSDTYLTVVTDQKNLNEEVTRKYGTLPKGVEISAHFEHKRKGRDKHFPVSYEEILENSTFDIYYECDNVEVLKNNLQTLISLRKKADLVDETIFYIDGYPLSVLKDGRIISEMRFIETPKYNGIEYPYLDDVELNQIIEQNKVTSDEITVNKTYDERAGEIEKELNKIGFQ